MSRWYKRCGADFIHGTMMLTLEEKGAYSLCLDLIYDRGGPIPDDARWLSGVCGVSMRKWSALRDRLISLGKLASENGLLSNSRAELELVSMELQRRNQAEAGAKGGRKRAENQFDYNVISGIAQATLKPIEEKRGDKKAPPSPRKRGSEGKHLLPDDWVLPTVEELPAEARACAKQWTAGSYAAKGEEFVSFWRSRGRMMKDWRLTWAGRVVAIHSEVMRDQKFGNAPLGSAISATSRPWTAGDLRRAIAYAEDHDDPERAAEYRARLETIEQPRRATGPPGRSIGEIVQKAQLSH